MSCNAFGGIQRGPLCQTAKTFDQLEASLKSNNARTACANIVATFRAFKAVHVSCFGQVTLPCYKSSIDEFAKALAFPSCQSCQNLMQFAFTSLSFEFLELEKKKQDMLQEL